MSHTTPQPHLTCSEDKPASDLQVFDAARIAVLIPCFNEASSIGKVARNFRGALPHSTIYVYDNNSTDGTAEIAAAAGAVVRRESRQGKGNVLRRMFREIDADCFLLVDGDDTYPAESAPDMVRLVLDEGADMVVGDRLSTTYFQENRRRFHSIGNTFVRAVINRLFHTDVSDVMTGFRDMSFTFVKTFPVLSEGFEIETEMSIHAADKRLLVMNFPISYRDRPLGSISKLDTYRDGARVLMMIAGLFRTYRPLLYFGGISFLLAFFGIVFVIPVFQEYFRTGLVARFPTLIVCCFVFLAAMISFFSGLILHTLRINDLQAFEMRLHEMKERDKQDRRSAMRKNSETKIAPALMLASLGVARVCAVKLNGKQDTCLEFLFIASGILTAFFDLLTCPLITFGMPAVTALLIREAPDNWKTQRNSFLSPVRWGFFWGFGYAGMHLFKWFLSSAVLKENSVQNAVDSLRFRLDVSGSYSGFDAISRNIDNYFGFPGVILVLICALCFAWRNRTASGKRFGKWISEKQHGLLFLSLLPLLWYLVFRNHSCIHSWMTYRSLAITMYGVLGWMLQGSSTASPG